MSDSKVKTGIMIALLPDTDSWCLIELPHLTLVYAGIIDEAEDDLEQNLLHHTNLLVESFYAPTLSVLGSSVFGGQGEDPKVDVLNLATSPDLKMMRRQTEKFSKSSFVEFNPHVTVGPVGSVKEVEVPETIRFGKIAFVFGTKKVVYDF